MANVQRGEVTLELGGKNYTLRPTFDALCQLEDRAGRSILLIMSTIEAGRIGLRELTLIVWSGMYGFDPANAPSLDDVGAMLLDEGIITVMEKKLDNGVNPITQFILNGVLGGEAADSGEKKQKGSEKGNQKRKTTKTEEPSTST